MFVACQKNKTKTTRKDGKERKEAGFVEIPGERNIRIRLGIGCGLTVKSRGTTDVVVSIIKLIEHFYNSFKVKFLCMYVYMCVSMYVCIGKGFRKLNR